MNWAAFSAAQLLAYQLPMMRKRIADAERISLAFLKRAAYPYVAFSTGKDSLVALDIALRLRHDIDVVWHDENWVLPDTLEAIASVEAFYNIRIIRVRERFADDEFFKLFGQWPVCCQPRPVDFEADHWPEIVAHYGWDGAIIALRKEESVARKFALKVPLRWHLGRGEWRVSPVHDWSYRDVWAYILGRNLPIHPAYPALIDLGIDPLYARVGPLTAVRVFQYGSLTAIKRLWPDAWNLFIQENPCVQPHS